MIGHTLHKSGVSFTEDEKRALWIAPSKGGVFTTSERAAFKTDEFNAARKANV